MTLNDDGKSFGKKGFFFLLFFLFIVYIFYTADHVFALSESEEDKIADVYINNSELFQNNGIIVMGVRWIGWEVTKFLVWLADSCESLYDTAFGFIDFTSWDKVNEFTESFKPLFVALMCLSLTALGIMLMVLRDKRPKILSNILIACLFFTCSTLIFQELNDIAFDLKKGIESVGSSEETEDASEIYSIVDQGMSDLVVLSDRFDDLENLDYEHKGKDDRYNSPGITEENFKEIDFNEVLNPKSDQYEWSSTEQDILGNKLFFTSEYGNRVREVYNGFGWNSADDADLSNEFYYRYQFEFIISWLKLIAFIIVYFCMAYKVTRIAYELVVARLLAFLYSAEVSGGEKIGKIFVFIRDSYILLLITTICIRLYGLFNAFITETVDNSFAQAVFIVFAAFCVIDGPNLVEKLLGMDAGLSSSTARMMAAYGAAKGAVSIVTAPFRMAGRAGMQNMKQDRYINKMEESKGANTKNTDQRGVKGVGNSGGDTKDETLPRGKDAGIGKYSSTQMGGEQNSHDTNYQNTDGSEDVMQDDDNSAESSRFMDDADGDDGYVHRDEDGKFGASFMDEKKTEMKSSVEPRKVKSDSDILNSMKEGKNESEYTGSGRN